MKFKHYNKFEKLFENIDAIYVLEFVFLNYYTGSDYYFNSQYFREKYGINILPILQLFSELFDVMIIDYEFKKESRKMNLNEVFDEYYIWKKNNKNKLEYKKIYDQIKLRKANMKNKDLYLEAQMREWLKQANTDRVIIADILKENNNFEEVFEVTGLAWFIKYSMEIYETINGSYRIYHPWNNMESDDRRKIFRADLGFIEVDLKGIHASIYAALTGHKLNRDQIIKDTNLPKHIVKGAINSAIYSGGEEGIKNGIRKEHKKHLQQKPDEEYIEHCLEILELNPEFSEIKNNVKKQNKEFTEEMVWNKYGITKPEYIENPLKLAHYFYTYIERWIMTSIIDYIKTNKIKIALDEHDGCTLYFSDVSSIPNHLKKLKEIVQVSIADGGFGEITTELVEKH